jgi:hypothetical protein
MKSAAVCGFGVSIFSHSTISPSTSSHLYSINVSSRHFAFASIKTSSSVSVAVIDSFIIILLRCKRTIW